MQTGELYPCPCCGYLTFDESPGSFAICPICFWEDDVVQLVYPRMTGGANHISLCEAQQNFVRFGACEQRFCANVRKPKPGECRDSGWRRLVTIDPQLSWESKSDQEFWQKHGKWQNLYWWRPDYWLARETPGWKFFRACCEGEDCEIAGVPVWAHKWRQISGEQVIVKDPHHGQVFRFDVYEISAGSQRAVFAAGEFSNGIFGFYVPAA